MHVEQKLGRENQNHLSIVMAAQRERLRKEGVIAAERHSLLRYAGILQLTCAVFKGEVFAHDILSFKFIQNMLSKP